MALVCVWLTHPSYTCVNAFVRMAGRQAGRQGGRETYLSSIQLVRTERGGWNCDAIRYEDGDVRVGFLEPGCIGLLIVCGHLYARRHTFTHTARHIAPFHIHTYAVLLFTGITKRHHSLRLTGMHGGVLWVRACPPLLHPFSLSRLCIALRWLAVFGSVVPRLTRSLIHPSTTATSVYPLHQLSIWHTDCD